MHVASCQKSEMVLKSYVRRPATSSDPPALRPLRLRRSAVSGSGSRFENMPEVIFTGPAGRIEGRYHPARQKNAPIGIVLHPHPQFGGTMNHQIVYQLYYAFVHRGLLRAALQLPRRRPQPGRLRPRHRRIVGRRRRRSTGRSRSIPRRAAAGSRASRSAPGSACSF